MTEIAQWAFEQLAPKVNPKLDLESSQSGDLGQLTREEAGGPGTFPLAGSKGVSVPTVSWDIKFLLV